MSLRKILFSKKKGKIKSYSDFWNWFQKNEKNFFKAGKQNRNIKKDFFGKLSSKLVEINDKFDYLTGMYDDSTVELVIIVNGSVKDITYAEDLVSSAPEIVGWKFTALKQALDINDTSIKI